MKIPPLAVTALALALAACSGSPTPTLPGQSNGGTETTPPANPDDGGLVDCAGIDSELTAAYAIDIQLLAQLRSQDTVDSVKEGVFVYDPDELEAALNSFKVLGGHGVAGLGDPQASIEFYLEANEKARAILAVDGPVPQEMFDDLVAFEGDLADFIGRQLPINAALSEACPS